MRSEDAAMKPLQPDRSRAQGEPAAGPRLGHNLVSMSSDLSLLFDPLCLFGAAALATWLHLHWLAMPALPAGFDDAIQVAVLLAAVLATCMLYDPQFGASASRGETGRLFRSHVLRFLGFAALLLTLGVVARALGNFPPVWLALWFAIGLTATLGARTIAVWSLQRLQRHGALTEVVAVVGTGPLADRFAEMLRRTRPHTVELLGLFDDESPDAVAGCARPVGTLERLIELGQTRRIDWIVLALPASAEPRMPSILQRLKTLSVPIGLCPQHVAVSLPVHAVAYVGETVPVGLMDDQSAAAWLGLRDADEPALPRWMGTVGQLTLASGRALWAIGVEALRTPAQRSARKRVIGFDAYDLDGFVDVAERFGQDRFGYAVTANADHLIRLDDDASFRARYAAADYVLLDSRFISNLLRATRGIQLPVCAGSDLTAALFRDVIDPDDTLVLIGGSEQQARQLAARYGLRGLAHHNPPMGFIRDPQAVEACLRFIEAHSPFRYCLLGVGAPQQEAIAQMLKDRGVARGLALCIGASVNFLTGEERRAPDWMQRSGLEWLFRLLQSPGRLGHRYLVRGPRVFALLRRAEIVLRHPPPLLRLVPPSSPVPLDAFESTGTGGRTHFERDR